MKILRQYQNIQSPFESKSIKIQYPKAQIYSIEEQLLNDRKKQALSYWFCKIAFADTEYQDWNKQQELKLFTAIGSQISTLQYQDYILSDFESIISTNLDYITSHYSRYIKDWKYTIRLLPFNFTIKNGITLIRKDQWKENQENLPKFIQLGDFVDNFESTNQLCSLIKQNILSGDNQQLKNLIYKIPYLIQQDVIVNHTEFMQLNISKQQIFTSQLPELVANSAIPLCMVNTINQLTRVHHMVHNERMQLYPYLSDINIQYDDAVNYIQRNFLKDTSISATIFKRDYLYGVQHIYGKVGKKQKAHSLGCQKIINSIPQSGYGYGCPFRSSGKKEIEDLLTQVGCVDPEARQRIFINREKKLFDNCCNTVFYWKFQQGVGLMNPVAYTLKAVNILSDKDNKDQGNNQGNNNQDNQNNQDQGQQIDQQIDQQEIDQQINQELEKQFNQ